MADTIHKKRKNWPHFDTIHLGSDAYADGWDRIFGKKAQDGKKINASGGRRKVQKTRRKTAQEGRQEP